MVRVGLDLGVSLSKKQGRKVGRKPVVADRTKTRLAWYHVTLKLRLTIC